MRLLFTITLLLAGFSAFSSDKTDSLLTVLKTELARKHIYDDQKELRIKSLKKQLQASTKNDFNTQYNICGKLYEEYEVYQYDSAYVYSQKLLNISFLTHDVVKQN